MSSKIENLEGEIWKDIAGYEGYYQVSNKGRIKSVNRVVKHTSSGYLTLKEKLIKCRANNRDGYIRCSLCKNKKVSTFLVHRLVAFAFIKNLENKPHINHLDEIKTNNVVENLEWVTQKENNDYSNTGFKNGTCHFNAKLTEREVREIRKLCSLDGYTATKLAKMFNVSRRHIVNIKLYKRWKHI